MRSMHRAAWASPERRWNSSLSISMAAVVKAADKNYITAHFGKGMGVRRMDSAGYDVSDEFDKGPNGNAHGQHIDVVNKLSIPDDNPKRIVDLTKRSVNFVREHAGKRPFYLMVSHYAVHIPHQASPPAIQNYRPRSATSQPGSRRLIKCQRF